MNLWGNLIDARVRNTQDQQTIGLPVGPDTSFILAELIGARIDQDLASELGEIRGTRYVDDFHLYFDSRADAEQAYAVLAKVAKKYELEVHDGKTELFEGPDTGEPAWKTALKGQSIRGTGFVQRSSFISFVTRAFELAKKYPGDGVLAYAVKKIAATQFDASNADTYEAFLRAVIVQDTSTMRLVTKLLYDRSEEGAIADEERLIETLGKLAVFHSRLRHQYEVSWALWLFKVLGTEVPEPVLKEIVEMDDPFVALLALDLRECGLATFDVSRWKPQMIAESLYSENWLLAYEAAKKGWLPMNGGDYIDSDPFFGVLGRENVSFFVPPDSSGVDYVSLGAGY